jgi:hypothetical protein
MAPWWARACPCATTQLFARSAWWAFAALLAWEVRSQTPGLPEGQLCPSVCTDLGAGRCPAIDEPVGDAPELYVGDPYNVQWPDHDSHPLCQERGNVELCCACGGGFVPDSCPDGRELQLTLPSRNETAEALPESLADQIGSLAYRATAPNLLRQDVSRRQRDRVRILSIESLTRQECVGCGQGSSGTVVDRNFWVVTFYFAAWYPWFPTTTALGNALSLGVNDRGLEFRMALDNRPLPPMLRVAPPDMRAYPNSIAYAEYRAGVGREEPECTEGEFSSAANCPRPYRHRLYPPEPRDLARNTTDYLAATLFARTPRPLVPGGRFVFPPCSGPQNRTWANEQCPVEDTTYCDEFHSLDLDCDGVLSLTEAAETTTWFDEPSYHALTPLSQLPSNVGSFERMLDKAAWDSLLGALDGDSDGYLSIFDWLKGSRVYKPTYQHCGEVLSDQFFRYINQNARQLGGDNGAFPICPCAACEMRWIYCELDAEGGGWNLVYESVGRTDFLMSTDEVNVEQLWDPSFGSKSTSEPDRYRPYQTQDTINPPRNNAGPTLRGGRDPQGAKLDDESIQHLCDGQYMIHRQGQHQIFCQFVNISLYGDDAESVKACSFDHDASYTGYQTLEPEEGSSFGFSTGLSATGVGTFGFVTQLGYLWGADGYYTLTNTAQGGSATGGDADYGASSHWVSPDDPNTEYSHYKPVDREVLTSQADPLRGSLGPTAFVEEQCLCSRQYTATTTTGALKRFGGVSSEATWLNSNEEMNEQV